MGIPDFLSRVLESAGQPLDLGDFATKGIVRVNKRRRRQEPLRIGIDVSSWVYKAAHGLGDMLGDERHLTNYGRAELHGEQQRQQEEQGNEEGGNQHALSSANIQEYVEACTKYVLSRLEILREKSQADLLVVMDGLTPPVKRNVVERRREVRQEQERLRDLPVDPNASPTQVNEQRTRAFRRAGAGRYHSQILVKLREALIQAQLPFLVAPYEADSQLAYLSQQGLIDLIITEDSDLVAHGAKAILYKSVAEIGSGQVCGKLLRFSDIGAVRGGNWNLMDFTPVMMAILFVSVGCDYCEKLKGIGLLTACRIIRKVFFLASSDSSSPVNRANSSPLETPVQDAKLTLVFKELYQNCYLSRSDLTSAFREDYEERFIQALFMFRHPIVYDPIQMKSVIVSRPQYHGNEENVPEPGSEGRTVGGGSLAVSCDVELRDHVPYVELCGDRERIESIVGKLEPDHVATAKAEGRVPSRTNPAVEERQTRASNPAVEEGTEGPHATEKTTLAVENATLVANVDAEEAGDSEQESVNMTEEEDLLTQPDKHPNEHNDEEEVLRRQPEAALRDDPKLGGSTGKGYFETEVERTPTHGRSPGVQATEEEDFLLTQPEASPRGDDSYPIEGVLQTQPEVTLAEDDFEEYVLQTQPMETPRSNAGTPVPATPSSSAKRRMMAELDTPSRRSARIRARKQLDFSDGS